MPVSAGPPSRHTHSEPFLCTQGLVLKLYWGRALIIALLLLLDFAAGYFLLLPAISTISFKLCDCNNTATGCTIASPQVLCYVATVLFYLVIALSYTMVTTILWMLLSLLWSFASALKGSAGVIQKWRKVLLHGSLLCWRCGVSVCAPIALGASTPLLCAPTAFVCPTHCRGPQTVLVRAGCAEGEGSFEGWGREGACNALSQRFPRPVLPRIVRHLRCRSRWTRC